jgi:hypothetical protein
MGKNGGAPPQDFIRNNPSLQMPEAKKHVYEAG